MSTEAIAENLLVAVSKYHIHIIYTCDFAHNWGELVIRYYKTETMCIFMDKCKDF